MQHFSTHMNPAGPIALTFWQYCVAGYACGLFFPSYPWPTFLCGLALASTVYSKRILGCMGLCCVLGILVSTPSAPDYSEETTHTYTVRGRVLEVRTYPGLRMNLIAGDLENLSDNTPVPGLLLWTWTSQPHVPVQGDVFTATMRLRPLSGRANFGLSSSQDYWHRLGVRWQSYAKADTSVQWERHVPNLRQQLMHQVRAQLPAGQAGATLMALLFGDKSDLTSQFMDQIRRAGLSHSLALSGLHLSLVAGLGYGLAWGIAALWPGLLLVLPRQKLGTVLAIPLATAYLWMGDAPASLQRAAIMLGIMAVYQLLGRVRYLQDALFLAAALLVGMNHHAIYDMGLQFSVLAVAGIVLFVPLFSRALPAWGYTRWYMRPVYGILAVGVVSLAANSLLLPVLCAYFGETSPHLYLNMLWLPVLGFLVLPFALAGTGLLVLGLPEPAVQACFHLAGHGVHGLEWLLNILDTAGLLNATVVLRPTGTALVGYWLILLAAAWLATRPDSRRAMAYLCAGLVLTVSSNLPPGLLPGPAVTLTVLDTGMSQAVMIRTMSGKTVLVDGGGSWNQDYDIGRAIVGPALTYGHPPHVDVVLLSHVDADHVRGLHHVFNTFAVGWFGWTGLVDTTQETTRLLETLDRTNPQIRSVRAGERIDLEADLYLEALYPPHGLDGISENNTSLVLRLVYRKKGLALLPGDAERPALARIAALPQDIEAEVLIAPHHGSVSSLEPSFLQRVAPAQVIAACSRENRFGFPHPRVRAYCADNKAVLWTTGEHGAVRCLWNSDGFLRITTARPLRSCIASVFSRLMHLPATFRSDVPAHAQNRPVPLD
ncbi:ComEC/Rec2 family competence protein [Desulfovibrionales bacterium]